MFLPNTVKKNPQMVEFAVYAHQTGQIRPNTYLLDLDMIQENAQKIVKTADQYQIQLYLMTKQFGRNSEIAKVISDIGISKAVAVDPWEAIHLAKEGIKLGHVGHLVQVPSGMIEEILSYHPDVITIFSIEKAIEISQVAKKLNRVQNVILRVVGEQDFIYPGQWGGFPESDLASVAERLKRLSHIQIVGVTSFPCLLYQQGVVTPTPNVDTLKRSIEKVNQILDQPIQQVNMPSLTTSSTIPILSELGATHGEPGHGLLGTTPLHQQMDQPEVPALVYVSEISHIQGTKAYAYSGGHYPRSHAQKAMVGKSFADLERNWVDISPFPHDAIDYYTELNLNEQPVSVGDTVIYAFRTQVFVTRSEVAVVSGIHDGTPEITGIYDHLGKRLR